ncbi:transposase [Oceanithermus sp.]|uniref:transposase n=1 Tax=Oceanithermus sp. TaxID=2268145 RepID=UPI0025801567|nr:transposase [Oceanithermus sp.]
MGGSPRRKPTRLADYDYRTPGVYFVTVVTRGRACLFGEVDEGGMNVNAAGRMVEGWWLALPGKFACVSLDAFVIMPNHFHGLLELNAESPVGADPRVGPHPRVGPEETGAHTGAPLQRKTASLPEIMRWFKTMTTNAYVRGVRDEGWPRFEGRLWQRSYHDRIVRDETELDRLREYIASNPLRWHLDRENPAAGGEGCGGPGDGPRT